ncbi:chemotaxis protein CheW [Massilia sp. RP-1-19]|uniref:Chemotaxis protein CheW n=1 Tax=Massilia polaris TaxID=2728846 RepID=A0A848HHP5_9BURK|nr:chemotaxis protein CheW [Massilia polaris]NML59689.1 chemotaxis protein CheW [Massilia polaris]
MYTYDSSAAGSGQIEFLSFRLGGLEYGLDFRKVQELRSLQSLERFASSGEIVEGVAVSRGVIMPIVDMRAAFSQGARPLAPTDVIILQLSSCIMGMVVDGVTDVVKLSPAQISPLPVNSDAGEAGCGYLVGLGEVDGRRLILVDIDKLMSIKRNAARDPDGAQQAA